MFHNIITSQNTLNMYDNETLSMRLSMLKRGLAIVYSCAVTDSANRSSQKMQALLTITVRL